MRVVEPGHVYLLKKLDGDGEPIRLEFVNREAGAEHPGTQTQEILRVVIDMLDCLIDRTNHCDACLRWEGNDRIVKAMTEAQRQARLAILLHEQRALERKMDCGKFDPATYPLGGDGHLELFRGWKLGQKLRVRIHGQWVDGWYHDVEPTVGKCVRVWIYEPDDGQEYLMNVLPEDIEA